MELSYGLLFDEEQSGVLFIAAQHSIIDIHGHTWVIYLIDNCMHEFVQISVDNQRFRILQDLNKLKMTSPWL